MSRDTNLKKTGRTAEKKTAEKKAAEKQEEGKKESRKSDEECRTKKRHRKTDEYVESIRKYMHGAMTLENWKNVREERIHLKFSKKIMQRGLRKMYKTMKIAEQKWEVGESEEKPEEPREDVYSPIRNGKFSVEKKEFLSLSEIHLFARSFLKDCDLSVELPKGFEKNIYDFLIWHLLNRIDDIEEHYLYKKEKTVSIRELKKILAKKNIPLVLSKDFYL